MLHYSRMRADMDKESIILKDDQLKIKDIKKDVQNVHLIEEENGRKLDDIQEKLNRARSMMGMEPVSPLRLNGFYLVDDRDNILPEEQTTEISFEDAWYMSSEDLKRRGIDPNTLDYHDLVTQDEMNAIAKSLNRPLTEREKWVQADFIATFIAAMVGTMADLLLGNRDNPLTGTNSKFSKWLNQVHDSKALSHKGDPIDYQGSGFGGGYHRELSKGHDILRFIEAIDMIQKGEFRAIRYENGIAIDVISKVNQNGTPYQQLSLIEAIIHYFKHMLADLCSTYSLPFPGSSFLAESSDRRLRIFAADMYRHGFNIKNVMTQSLSTAVIEIILRIYSSVTECHDIPDTDEAYREAMAQFEYKDAHQEKLNEMLLVAHSICTAINIGKIVINKTPWEINVTEIFSVAKYGIKVAVAAYKRNNEFEKMIRNSEEIHHRWAELEEEVCNHTSEEISTLQDMECIII